MSKILLVEDNKLSQKMMFYTFKHLGIEADVAEDGQQAADMVLANSYDVVLMDIMMPILDGYEATQKIREYESPRGLHTFIVGLTCNVYDEERTKCLKAGMDEYLPKPFDYDKLKVILSQNNISI